jgi:putative endopeptidase
LYGLQEPPPRWKFCISETDNAVGELLGAYFADVSFGAVSKKLAQQMVLAIESAMAADLQTVSWMDQQTRNLALDKMNKMANLIGYPDNPRNYTDLPVLPNAFWSNTVASRNNAMTRAMNTVGGASDRYQWLMTADTINAYYDPTRNEMVFPAGILQTPYFNASWPLVLHTL